MVYIGWPRLERRQKRVCLAVRQFGKRRCGFFARVGEVEGNKLWASSKPLMVLWLTPSVLEVHSFLHALFE